MNPRDVPIPDRMKHLPVDARGYVIPWGVQRDLDGRPHFAMNNEYCRRRSVAEDLCGICGRKLFRGRWWIGGLLAAFHEHGAFIDPPTHSECAHYAIRVCPYLAAPRYVKEIGIAKARTGNFPDHLVAIDTTAIPGRPTDDVFALVMATSHWVHENFNTKPKPPYSVVEFWRHGQQISGAEGQAALTKALLTVEIPPPIGI